MHWWQIGPEDPDPQTAKIANWIEAILVVIALACVARYLL